MDKMTMNWRDRRKSKPANGTVAAAASNSIRPLLTENEVAALLGIMPQTLRNARSGGTGGLAALPWVKLGTRVRYRPEAVERYLAGRERSYETP